jgi:hypothetical protein
MELLGSTPRSPYWPPVQPALLPSREGGSAAYEVVLRVLFNERLDPILGSQSRGSLAGSEAPEENV